MRASRLIVNRIGQIQLLECRLHFAGFASITSRGTLVVAGTESSDVISVRKRADSIVVHRNMEELAFSVNQVRRVSIDAGEGDDNIAMKIVRRATLRGGTGDDILRGSVAPDLIDGGVGNNFSSPNGGGDVLDFSQTPRPFLELFDIFSGSTDGRFTLFPPRVERRYIDGDFPSSPW